MNRLRSKIIFIGTSSGKTSIKRNHSSLLIKSPSHKLLVDAGDGISKSLLALKISINDIDSVIFTHNHADHFAGIASLVTQMKLDGRKNKLILYTHNNLLPSIKNILDSVYMYKENLGFKINFIGYEFGRKKSICDEIIFTAKQNSHIKRKEKLKKYPKELFVSSSLMFNITEKKIFYSSDIGNEQDLYLFKNKKTDYAITECSHIGFDELIKFFMRTNPRKLFITHYDDTLEAGLKKRINSLPVELKNKLVLCGDGFSFQI